jgi:hypothetical protein
LDGSSFIVVALWVTRCSDTRNDLILYAEETEDIFLVKHGLQFLEKRKANTERFFDKKIIMR